MGGALLLLYWQGVASVAKYPGACTFRSGAMTGLVTARYMTAKVADNGLTPTIASNRLTTDTDNAGATVGLERII